MNLSNLIDLIAEVAAKRTAREGETRSDEPEQAGLIIHAILAKIWRASRFSTRT